MKDSEKFFAQPFFFFFFFFFKGELKKIWKQCDEYQDKYVQWHVYTMETGYILLSKT